MGRCIIDVCRGRSTQNRNRSFCGCYKCSKSSKEQSRIGKLPAVATNTKDAFLDAILIERGHELFYEGNRKIDLIRFNKYAQEMYKAKGVMPTHQYMPIPNYAVEQAVSYGKELKQTWERPGWAEDKSKAQQNIN